MRFVFEHDFPLPLETVFSFYANPANMRAIYSGPHRFRLLRHAGHVAVGAQTWIEVDVFSCIPVVMGFQHVEFVPPHRFAEEAIHGPFSRFVHTHDFEDCCESTRVRDTLEIDLPWQYGGRLSMRTVVAPKVRRMFAHRAQRLAHLAANDMLNTAALEHMKMAG